MKGESSNEEKISILLTLSLLSSLIITTPVFAADNGEESIQPRVAGTNGKSYTDGKGFVYHVSGTSSRVGTEAYVSTTFTLQDWFIPTQAEKDDAIDDVKGVLATATVGTLNLASDTFGDYIYIDGATYTLTRQKTYLYNVITITGEHGSGCNNASVTFYTNA